MWSKVPFKKSASLSQVLEAAVVGVPYEHQEQAVRAFIKAFIVLKHGEEATEEEIRRLCEERLDEYKIHNASSSGPNCPSQW